MVKGLASASPHHGESARMFKLRGAGPRRKEGLLEREDVDSHPERVGVGHRCERLLLGEFLGCSEARREVGSGFASSQPAADAALPRPRIWVPPPATPRTLCSGFSTSLNSDFLICGLEIEPPTHNGVRQAPGRCWEIRVPCAKGRQFGNNSWRSEVISLGSTKEMKLCRLLGTSQVLPGVLKLSRHFLELGTAGELIRPF